MNNQEKSTNLKFEPLAEKLERIKTRSNLENSAEKSKERIGGYIRLEKLIAELFDLVNKGIIALHVATELSYLHKDEQRDVFRIYQWTGKLPSYLQALKMRKTSDAGFLTIDEIAEIMSEDRSSQIRKICLLMDEIKEYLPDSLTDEQIKNYIICSLKYYKKYLAHMNNQNNN